MDVLLLRFDAPMMSFGAPIVDQEGKIQAFPARSMITGLAANALGYDHREFEKIQRLQERISHASRCDCRGRKIQDYQRVDLGQDFMKDSRAWTTRGKIEKRAGGSPEGLHIRHRDYWVDSVHTVALTLLEPEETPTIRELAQAFREPERPLFIGRKPCLPAGPLYLDEIGSPSLKEALQVAPLAGRTDSSDSETKREAWWPVDQPDRVDEDAMVKPITDRRDWANQIHTGERWVAHGSIAIEDGAIQSE